MIYSNRDNDAQSSDPDCIIGLNMIFQFLFQELKDTKVVRRYIIRKMTMEFKELLNSKAAGKIIQKISVKQNKFKDYRENKKIKAILFLF